MKKNTLKIISIIFIILIIAILNNISIAEEQNVSLTLSPKPKIDIALSKSDTTINLTTFEEDIKKELTNIGVDPDDLKISAIETQTISSKSAAASTIFNTWQKYPTISGSNFEAQWTLSGDEIYTKANVHWTGFWNKEASGDSNYTIDFDVMNGDHDPLGFTFRMNQVASNEYKFYGVELDTAHNTVTLGKITSWIPSASDEMHGGPIYHTKISATDNYYDDYTSSSNANRLSHCKGERLTYTSYTVNQSVWYHVKIEAKGNRYKIYVNNTLVIDYTDNNNPILSGGYGPYTDSNPNGHFKNVQIVTEKIKGLTEIVRLPDWREGAYKFLVHVEDYEDKDLSNNSVFGEIVTNLINEGVYFVGWGSNNNKTQFEKLIELNNKNGTYLENSDYKTNVSQTAIYIKSILDSIESSQYLILNEPLNINVDPAGILKDTIDEKWPYGKWLIEHDYTYFDNDIGQFVNSNKYMNNFINEFDKVGRYQIKYKNVLVQPTEIFVHRRPIASFDMIKNETQLILNSKSKDLDTNLGTNGIKNEEWKWVDTSTTTWNTGKLTDIDTTKDYIIQLKTQDYQNTWSSPVSKYSTSNTNALPIALFSLVNKQVSRYENLEIKDDSYDPVGRDLTTYLWEVYKGEDLIYSNSTPLLNYKSYGLGNYTIYLTVTNTAGQKSARFGRKFEITNDVIAPEFIATPIRSEWNKKVTVNLKFTDRGGSLYRGYRYAITDNQETPKNDPTTSNVWSEEKSENIADIEITDEGEKYLHVKGYDNDKNESIDRVLGPYKIDNSLPIVDIRANFETPTIQPITVTINTRDIYSGVKSVMIDTKKLEHTDTNMFTISKNGTYKLKVEDNAGNIYTEDIVVTNINCTCDAGLNHPEYSSTLNSCPICDLIKNLEVTNNKVIYNSNEQRVTYEGVDRSIIVEYYNESKTKPVVAGDYYYDLKVIYNQVEYNTGKTGIFTIEKKKININNIVAINRQYNANTIVNLEGGELVGVEEKDIDKVNFVLPKTGTIDNKNSGEHNVTISEITLTGEKSNNYLLIQPFIEEVSVTISKKDITIENINGIERQYNASTVVNLEGGNLVGVEEKDIGKVRFILAETGTIDNKNIGEHNVTVPEIVLVGEEAYNYSLKQPELQDVNVNIIPKEINIINITTINRKYNGLTEINITGGELVGVEEIDKEKVEFALPKTGTMESKNIGENNVTIPEVVLIGEEAYNYTLIQAKPEEVKATIIPKDITIENIIAQNREYDGTTIVEISGGELVGVEELDLEKVGFITEKTGTIESKDIGEYNVIIPEIKLNGEEASNYNLIHPKEDAVKVTIEKRKITIEGVKAKNRRYNRTDIIEIDGGKLQNVIEGEDVRAVIPKIGKIQDKEKYGTQVVEIGKIILAGKDIGNYELIQPEKDSIIVTILKADTPSLYIEPSISSVNGKDANSKIRYGDEVELTLKIYNKGAGGGFAEKVIDTIPEGVEFIKDNEINKKYGWKVKPNNKVETEILSSNNLENEIKPLENELEKNDTEEKDITENTIIDENIINSENTLTDENATNTEENTVIKESNITEGNVSSVNVIKESNITEENISSVKVVKENNVTEENISSTNEVEESNVIEENISSANEVEERNIIEENFVETENGITEENITENTLTEDTIQKKDEIIENGSLYKELKLVLRVTDSKGKYSVVKNKATLEQVNIRKDKIKNETDEKEAILDIRLSYTDLSVENRIKEIIETRPDMQISYPIRNYNLAKIEIHKNNINTSKLEVTYEIVIRNTGWDSGNIDKLEFAIPEGMTLLSKEQKTNGNTIILENLGEIKPGETKRKEIKLQAKARDLLGTSESKATVFSEEDIDQRKISKENNNKINKKENKIEKTNNTDKSDFILAIKTGKDVNNYINILAIISLTITGAVVYIVFRKNN